MLGEKFVNSVLNRDHLNQYLFSTIFRAVSTPTPMQLMIFATNPQGLLELVSEPTADDEDVIVVPVIVDLPMAA